MAEKRSNKDDPPVKSSRTDLKVQRSSIRFEESSTQLADSSLQFEDSSLQVGNSSTLDIRPSNDEDNEYMTATDILEYYGGDRDSDDEEEEEDETVIKARLGEDVSKEAAERTQKWLALPREFTIKMPKTHLRAHHEKTIVSSRTVFQLLLWKNFKLFTYKSIVSSCEFFIPIIAITIITIYLSTLPNTGTEPLMYDPFPPNKSLKGTFHNCHNFVYISRKRNVYINKAMSIVEEDLNNDAQITTNKHFKVHEERSYASYEEQKYHSICALVVFDGPNWTNNDSLPQNISYEIRMPATHEQILSYEENFYFSRDSWHTRYIFPPKIKTVARNKHDKFGGDPGYVKQGFIYLQSLVQEAMINVAHAITQKSCNKETNITKKASTSEEIILQKRLTSNIDTNIARFPLPPYLTSDKLEIIHEDLAFVVTFTFIFPMLMFLNHILYEKENGLRVQLSSHCVSLTMQNVAWIIRGLCVHTLMAVIITLILEIPWTTDGERVLGETDAVLFVAFLMAVLWNALCLACFIGSLFHRVTTGIFVLTILWMMNFSFYFYVSANYKYLSFFVKFMGCNNAQLGIVIGLHAISEFESFNIRLGWSDLFYKGEFTLGWAIFSLILHGFIFIGATAYTENIFCEQGQLVLPVFHFKESWYWNGEMPPDLSEADESTKGLEEAHPEHFEDESKKRRRKELEIINVSKYYGDVKVLKNINLTCFYGQLNLLVAGTSEGKTTLIKIINGMTPATSGTVLVSTLHLAKERRLAQSFIGHCPQKTSLYQNLTVEETLLFYARLKGMVNAMETMEEVERLMSNAYLTDFRNCRVGELTVTCQRLLMITTAFCGGSRIILLDEPTEGMDACQKRVVWEFISKEKHHRTILATAGTMDEAETCVDKVAILCRGQIQCRGTPKFILARLGGGYFLTLKKGPKYNEAVVKGAVEEIMPGTVVTDGEDSVSFNIQSDDTSKFPMLFDELELDPFLGIADVQLSYISLDEIQNRLYMHTEIEDIENNTERDKILREARPFEIIPNEEMPKLSLMLYQFKHLLLKNVRFHIRRKLQFWTATLAPILAAAIPCAIISIYNPFEFDPVPVPMNLSHELYGTPLMYVDCVDKIIPNSGVHICNAISDILGHQFPDIKIIEVQDIMEAMTYHRQDEVDGKSIRSQALLGVSVHSKNGIADTTALTGYFNNYAFHLIPVILVILDDLRLSFSVGQACSNRKDNYSFSLINNPLPIKPWDKIASSQGLISPGFFVCFCFTLGLCAFFSTVPIMYVLERKFRHLQIMSGANLALFWISNYLWTMAHYTVEVIIILVILVISDIPEFNTSMVDDLFILLVSGGICNTLMIGVASNIRHAHAGLAFSKTLMLMATTGPGFLIVLTTLHHSIWYEENEEPFYIFHYFLLLFPSYSLASGFLHIYVNTVLKYECDRKNTYSFVGHGIGSNLVAMWTESALFVLLNVFLESDKFRRLAIKYHAWQRKKWKIVRTHLTDLEDLVVVDETAAAKGMKEEESHFGLNCRDLSVQYPYSTPVDNLNLFIMNGEVFGLLGERHSDKDELISLLAGTLEPTSGDIFFNRKTLMRSYKDYMKQIGYCSFESPFLEELTGRETMLLIGSLKGTRPETMEGIMSNLAIKLFILQDLNNVISKYSHAIKRKLNAACSMMGDPRLCIFDEPSIGLDADSRFYLWNCIRSFAKGGCTVLISSHNMEECQEFCTKVGMFINGKIRCIGTVHELKARHSIGYAVVVRFNPTFTERHFTTVEDSHRRAKEQAEIVANNDRRLREQVKVEEYKRTTLGPDSSDVDDINGADTDVDVQTFLDYRAKVAHDLGSINSTAEIMRAIRAEDLSHWERDLLPFMRYFEKRIPCSLLDIQPNFLFYHIEKDICKWSDIFTTMEEAKLLDWTSPIESYYVGETSLEQMFLNYIRGQQPKGEATL